VVGDGYDGQGNEVLTYIEGEIINPHPWSDEAIWRVGRLLRQLHVATASFRPPPEAVWQPWYFHSDTPGSIIGHCDTGPWHIVARDGLPVAFIDWTLAGADRSARRGRGHRLVERPAPRRRHRRSQPPGRRGYPRRPAAPVPGRLRAARGRGAGLVTNMIEFAIRDCAWEAIRAQVTPESTDPTPLWALAWRARAAAGMLRHRPTLQHAIEPYSPTTGPPGSSP
jgi:hypothetical protein